MSSPDSNDALLSNLSEAAEEAIQRSQAVAVSPMVRPELGYLHEIGRILAPPADTLTELRRSVGRKESDQRLATIIDAALDITWTRDTFDRLIVAEAASLNADLVTKDSRIREHYARAIW
jgi:PIN domain nuclease of toxin-antitoxin system